MSTKLNAEYACLSAVANACTVVLGLNPELPVSVFKTFLGVCLWGGNGAGNEPLQLQELALRIGLPTTTVSRHLRYLGDWERQDVPGMGLVRTDINVRNRRQKVASLTPQGIIVAGKLGEAVADLKATL